MLDLLRARLAQGARTVPLPVASSGLPERFRGRPLLDPAKGGEACGACARRCPSEFLTIGPDGRPRLDIGACLFSPEEAAACEHGAVRYTTDYRLAASRREDLTTAGEAPRLAEALAERSRRLFGRSLRLRSVSAGSCNGCEAELVALSNVVFDMARFGIQFVASPRHADGVVVTGAVSRNMDLALRKTYEAVPAPKLVIAVGACAINGGPFRGSPEVLNGVPSDLPVDLWVPGCPPHPLTVLDGLLRLLGRIADGER
ncbi:MAG: NADH-quinone oxidoreductase subunit NuoB [Gemmatimonadetes bacterium]|nr:NADH-quinone oxidoreductase subunit NuoB [Gemmatimonadota bacterium]